MRDDNLVKMEQDIEYDLADALINLSKAGDLTDIQTGIIARDFLNKLPFGNVQEIIDMLSRLKEAYPVLDPLYSKYLNKQIEINEKGRATQLGELLKNNEIDRAVDFVNENNDY